MKRVIIKDILLVALGNVFLALGVGLFIIPNNILSGGVAGIAVALSGVIAIDATLIINVLTVILFFIGFLMLGKGFAIKTLLSTIMYPVFLSIVTHFSDMYVITNQEILASVYGGLLIGAGVGLVFSTGATTGGMDIPPLVFHKYTHIPLARLVLITDALTVLFGVSVYGIEAALIGLLSVFSGAYMVNRMMMFGIGEAKSLMIISDKFDEIYKEVSQKLDRGGTIIKTQGAHTRSDNQILMVIISKKQFPYAHKIIQSIDPNAFLIVNDVNEVHGEGFTYG